MFITSRNFSQLRELISFADAERNNPEVILIGYRKHPEMNRRQSNYPCTTCGKRGADVLFVSARSAKRRQRSATSR
jgi:4-hydroxy-3-methylbut-2-enyl diphosphate reductase IspH